MTITPDAPQTDVRMIDGIPLTPKEVTTIGFEDLVPKATIEEERLHRKQRLAGALRIFGRFGFGELLRGSCQMPLRSHDQLLLRKQLHHHDRR